jgi:hypothetical protein
VEKSKYVCRIFEKVVTEATGGKKQMLKPDEKVVLTQEYYDGICPERTREMQFWAKNINSVNGLLMERAENMARLKDLIADFSGEVSKLKDEGLTFNTTDGDTSFKTILIQLQDSLTKNDQFIANAINQQIKFEELKQRDREGPKTIDVAAVEAHVRKTLSAAPLQFPTTTPVAEKESGDVIPDGDENDN